MAHPVWSGYLSFGLISLPVRAFAAARPESIELHFLHKGCGSRVGQQFYCKREGKVIEASERVKAFEYGPEQYVTLEKDELEAIEPETAEEMKVLEFVPADAIDPVYLESSYYLMPQDAGTQPYALLAKALAKSGYAALAKLAMHNREHSVVIRAKDGGLMLHTLFYADEVRAMEGFGEATPANAKEVKMLEKLIRALKGDWQPGKNTDTYRVNLQGAIDAKIAGQKVESKGKRKNLAPVVDLSSAIKQSLKAAKAKSPKGEGDGKAGTGQIRA